MDVSKSEYMFGAKNRTSQCAEGPLHVFTNFAALCIFETLILTSIQYHVWGDVLENYNICINVDQKH